MKYFQDTEEYPRNVAFNPLPWNVLYEYVSSTFLNGFINYVKIKKAYLLSRYTEEEEIVHDVDIIDTPGVFPWQWIKFSGTKKEVFDRLTAPDAIFHSKLDQFKDDVLILSKIEIENIEINMPENNFYMFFWYDCDCSDCCIGRFFTEDTETQVIEEFDKFVKERHNKLMLKNGLLREIPIDFFKGWISG